MNASATARAITRRKSSPLSRARLIRTVGEAINVFPESMLFKPPRRFKSPRVGIRNLIAMRLRLRDKLRPQRKNH